MDRIRDDIASVNRLSRSGFPDLEGKCSHFHRSEDHHKEVDREEGPLDLTSWNEVKKIISDFKYLKLAEVYEINEMMVESWKSGMDARKTRKFNALCGTEIEGMLQLVKRYRFDSRELSRHSKLEKKCLELCDHNKNGQRTKFGE